MSLKYLKKMAWSRTSGVSELWALFRVFRPLGLAYAGLHGLGPFRKLSLSSFFFSNLKTKVLVLICEILLVVQNGASTLPRSYALLSRLGVIPSYSISHRRGSRGGQVLQSFRGHQSSKRFKGRSSLAIISWSSVIEEVSRGCQVLQSLRSNRPLHVVVLN